MPTFIGFLRSCFWYAIPDRPLALFFDSIAFQLNSGMAIGETMMNAAQTSGDIELRAIGESIAPKLRNGASLHASLMPYRNRFPEIVMAVIEVGEVSGGLGDSARRLADAFNQSASSSRKLRMNVWDTRMCILALCVMQALFLMIKASSSLTQGAPLPSLVKSIIEQVALFASEVSAAYLFGRVIVRILYRWQLLRRIVDQLKLALPGIGLVFRQLAIARWARSFAVLWGAGINVSKALDVSSRSTLNAYYEQAIVAAARQTRTGRSLAQSLSQTQLLPPYMIGIIATSEEAGRMDDQLLMMATDMERDAYNRALEEMNKIVMASQIILMIAAFGLFARTA